LLSLLKEAENREARTYLLTGGHGLLDPYGEAEKDWEGRGRSVGQTQTAHADQ